MQGILGDLARQRRQEFKSFVVRHDRGEQLLFKPVALSAQVLADAIGDAICPRDERLPEARHLAGQLDFIKSPGQDPLIPESHQKRGE